MTFYTLLALIACATDRAIAKSVPFLRQENKILLACIPGEIHTKAVERQRLFKFDKTLDRAIEELIPHYSWRPQ